MSDTVKVFIGPMFHSPVLLSDVRLSDRQFAIEYPETCRIYEVPRALAEELERAIKALGTAEATIVIECPQIPPDALLAALEAT